MTIMAIVAAALYWALAAGIAAVIRAVAGGMDW